MFRGLDAKRFMKLEVDALAGAVHFEESPLRLAQCNGYRERYL